MKRKTYPVKLAGDIGWVPVTGQQMTSGVVNRAFMRTGDEIVIDCEGDGIRYNVLLKRTVGCSFEGRFPAQKGQKSYQVTASCNLYSNDEGYFLSGDWLDEDWQYKWWSELRCIERFADEE